LAPAVQYFVCAENAVFLVVINAAGLAAAHNNSLITGDPYPAKRVVQSWLSYVTDVVTVNAQRCRTILVGTHRDTAEQNKTAAQDLACLEKLCDELRHSYPASSLEPQALFVNSLDRKESRSALWRAVQNCAEQILNGQQIPIFIDSCVQTIQAHAADPSTAKWCTFDELLAMPMMNALNRDQQRSAYAALRKMGYIITLPSGIIILKPQWFAAAASVTLSPNAGDNDGDALALHISTDRDHPGLIRHNGLRTQLVDMQQVIRQHFSQSKDAESLAACGDPLTEATEVNHLIEFLRAIDIVLADPLEEVRNSLFHGFACVVCCWNACLPCSYL